MDDLTPPGEPIPEIDLGADPPEDGAVLTGAFRDPPPGPEDLVGVLEDEPIASAGGKDGRPRGPISMLFPFKRLRACIS